MARLKPIKPEAMTAAQMSAYKVIEAKGGRLGGPYSALIRIPEFMLLHQEMGDNLRKSSLTERMRKIIVLTTVKHWGAKYAWAVNVRSAEKDGMEKSLIDAIKEGREPELTNDKEHTVYKVARELLESRNLSDTTYHAAVGLLGETSLADAVATTGFYSMVSMTLIAFDVDPPS
ncbi:MAG: carboxymuconolactone decarboxylase family protein [Burkholderiales bacterium]